MRIFAKLAHASNHSSRIGITAGLIVSPGAASGLIAFDADLAEQWGLKEKKAVIMVRPQNKPDDVHGMLAAKGILTSRGGRTSHAARVRMQMRAIIAVACICQKKGSKVYPKIMLPRAAQSSELRVDDEILEAEAKQVMKEQGMRVKYEFGTMIEIPRAALTADQIAKYAQFFSFGTNDLTQTTFGISRDDAETGFLREYLEKRILPENPFATIDEGGVGKLMDMGVRLGRSTRPDLQVGICGEHGGDPKSIDLCHRIGLDYVSCSPFRVPIARLAAAHAVLKERHGGRR